MNASKLYVRDILGLGLVISSIMVMLGVIFSILGLFNYLSNEVSYATTYFQTAIPLLCCVMPSILLAKVINKPQWVHDIQTYQLEAAKRFSQTH
ncbi:D-fructose-6-phosphate amidotransferase [Photobacterium aquae]|uniref:D-fructose-6-phosphate amidotransferase n=1 Tax=Photobacterium aquae TaxID=1195763 RepID=A0A0J1GXG2_9GAMM|nr:hypothetical protein [Photobacterium aquae]KLV04139.1 D-fructose-6-phosphate amidotransferase [Photobacterium aquae]